MQLDFFRILLQLQFEVGKVSPISIGELSVKDKQDQYTPGFIELLGDYYLYL